MLSGVKFIPRDQLHKEQEDDEDAASLQKRKKRNGSSSKSGRDKHKTKRKTSSRYDSSDGITSSASDDDLVRIKKGSSRNKKWYSSDEHSSEDYSGSEGEDSYDQYSSKRKSRGKKNKKNGGKNRSSADLSSEDDGWKGGGKDRRNRGKKKVSDDFSDDGRKSHSMKDMEIARKEMGLDWMLRSSDKVDKKPAVTVNVQPEQTSDDEVERVNPKELNPYLKGNGSGYPDNVDDKRAGEEQLPSSALVGDGGASWRLKALKRAREQAVREGRQLEDVVEERWGSLGQLAVTVASGKAASSRAHLHAINNRRRGLYMERKKLADNQNGIDTEQGTDRGYLKDVSVRHPDMRAPKVHDSLSWGKQKSQKMSTEDASLISAAASSLNKFANDGSFMNKVLGQRNDDFSGSVGFDANQERKMDSNMDSYDIGKPSDDSAVKEVLSANQLAAKALQLRIKGKHQEADKLMQEDENIKVRQGDENSQYPIRHQRVGSMVRHVKDISAQRKEEDADRYLAQKIIQNKQYSLSGQADDEYDFEDAPGRKSKKKRGGGDHNVTEKTNLAKRILTQQERCLFCFENPNRPKHLVLSIANFTYLMLPQRQSVVPGHCLILTMQHESATRTVDNNVWGEIRNFKKCLIMMFAKQEKELIFLETVMGLAQQRHHCLIECIPLPQKVAKQAPLYFKKAIDEAEDEWSQHNAKKLIDTSEKGLRGSIPKDFPYFHVEFGLNSGFVHVIDDEKQFKRSLGLNVIRGMLRLPEEDMYRHRRHESVEVQRQAVASFAQDWEPFDWTKQLD